MTRRAPLAGAFLVFLLAGVLPLIGHPAAHAHPLGNFTINRHARIELYGDAIVVTYAVDIAEIPTFQLLQEIDAGDGSNQSRLDSYARKQGEKLAAGLTLAVDGKRLHLSPLSASIRLSPGTGGLNVARLDVVYRAQVTPTAGQANISFIDANFADRAGWKEIVVSPSPGAEVSIHPRLTVDTSDSLRNYPPDSLKSPPNDREVSFGWVPGTGASAPVAAAVQAPATGRSVGGFASLLKHRSSPGIILLSLLAAFGFGALHAVGPGHGKSVVAAYLTGSKGTVRHAMALGLTVTATHTSTVYVLGLVTLTASAYIVPERLYLYLGVASGVMVVCMGAWLSARRLWHGLRSSPEGEHRHGRFGPRHTHTHAAHGHEHPAAAAQANGVTWRSLAAVGVAGGLLPCPSAIVVMLAAISLGQVFFGMLLIVAFSAGLASVLTAIALAVVVGKRVTARYGPLRLVERKPVAMALGALPVVSALGLTLAGILITYQAYNQPGV